MRNKLLVIISSSDRGVAGTGMMYASNALRNSWMENVVVIFFGPAQKLLIEDSELQELLVTFQKEGGEPSACKFISDREKTTNETEFLGVNVEYVGQMISDYIKDGFVPMVW